MCFNKACTRIARSYELPFNETKSQQIDAQLMYEVYSDVIKYGWNYFDIAHLSGGTYIFKMIEGGKHIHVQKFVKI